LLKIEYPNVLELFTNPNRVKIYNPNTAFFPADIYGKCDKLGNKSVGFEGWESPMFFPWREVFIKFMELPNTENLEFIENLNVEYFEEKDYFQSVVGLANQILQEIVQKTRNDYNYQEYDYDNKEQFFKRAFLYKFGLQSDHNLNELDEIELNNINYLLHQYFESTL